MNLREALRARRIPYRDGRGDELSLCCPFCTDSRFRLGVNTRTGQANCFNCNWKRRKGAVQLLAKKLEMGEISGPTEEKKTVVEKVTLPKDFTLLWDVKDDSFMWYRKALDYLVLERRLLLEQIKEKKIGISLTGRYAYRIIFPVYMNRLVGLVTRDFTGTQKRPYLNSPGEKGLYNIPPIKNRGNTLVITEGVFDCLSVERAFRGYPRHPDTCALLGRALTEVQENQLRGYTQIILWPDNDRPGIQGMCRIAEQLKNRYMVMWVSPSSKGKDAGELSEGEIVSMYDRMIPWKQDVSVAARAREAFRE